MKVACDICLDAGSPCLATGARSRASGTGGEEGGEAEMDCIHIYMAGISEDFRPKSFGLEILSSQPKMQWVAASSSCSAVQIL